MAPDTLITALICLAVYICIAFEWLNKAIAALLGVMIDDPFNPGVTDEHAAATAMASNPGGAATLVGDPSNIIIGSKWGCRSINSPAIGSFRWCSRPPVSTCLFWRN